MDSPTHQTTKQITSTNLECSLQTSHLHPSKDERCPRGRLYESHNSKFASGWLNRIAHIERVSSACPQEIYLRAQLAQRRILQSCAGQRLPGLDPILPNPDHHQPSRSLVCRCRSECPAIRSLPRSKIFYNSRFQLTNDLQHCLAWVDWWHRF